MTYTPEQITAMNKANVQAIEGLTAQAYSGFEKLVELNMAASKAVLGDSLNTVQAALNAKDPQELLAQQANLLKPLAEKSAAYGQQVYSLATGTTAELTKVIEAKTAEAQTAFTGAVESLVKNAPAGSESAVAAFKSALAAGQNVMESAQSSAKKAVELAESSIKAATNQAVDAASKASKKR